MSHEIKIVFVDRDGVVNRRLIGDWVKSWEEFEFLPGVHESLALLKQKGYKTVLITNQRGLSLNLMTEKGLKQIHDNMQQSLEVVGAKFDDIYICPHGKEDACGCRKPEPGMLLQASDDHGVEIASTVMIGDSETDRQAAQSAGCRDFFFVDDNCSLADCVDQFLMKFDRPN